MTNSIYVPPLHALDDLKNEEDAVGELTEAASLVNIPTTSVAGHVSTINTEQSTKNTSNRTLQQLEHLAHIPQNTHSEEKGWLKDRLLPEDIHATYGNREPVGASSDNNEAVSVLTRGLNRIADSPSAERRTKEEERAVSAAKGTLSALRKQEDSLM